MMRTAPAPAKLETDWAKQLQAICVKEFEHRDDSELMDKLHLTSTGLQSMRSDTRWSLSLTILTAVRLDLPIIDQISDVLRAAVTEG